MMRFYKRKLKLIFNWKTKYFTDKIWLLFKANNSLSSLFLSLSPYIIPLKLLTFLHGVENIALPFYIRTDHGFANNVGTTVIMVVFK